MYTHTYLCVRRRAAHGAARFAPWQSRPYKPGGATPLLNREVGGTRFETSVELFRLEEGLSPALVLSGHARKRRCTAASGSRSRTVPSQQCSGNLSRAPLPLLLRRYTYKRCAARPAPPWRRRRSPRDEKEPRGPGSRSGVRAQFMYESDFVSSASF